MFFTHGSTRRTRGVVVTRPVFGTRRGLGFRGSNTRHTIIVRIVAIVLLYLILANDRHAAWPVSTRLDISGWRSGSSGNGFPVSRPAGELTIGRYRCLILYYNLYIYIYTHIYRTSRSSSPPPPGKRFGRLGRNARGVGGGVYLMQ